jgi:hypothetical protein
MSPILKGVVASGISGHLTPLFTSNFEAIQSQTLGSAGSTVTFSSIPQTYNHLQLRITATTASSGRITMLFNSSTTGNQAFYWLYANGTTASSDYATGMSYLCPGYTDGSSNPTYSVTDIMNYTNTNKNRTYKSLSMYNNNTSSYQIIANGIVWFNGSGVASDQGSAWTYQAGSGNNGTLQYNFNPSGYSNSLVFGSGNTTGAGGLTTNYHIVFYGDGVNSMTINYL